MDLRDFIHYLLKFLVGLQLFFIALFLDGHWGATRKAVQIIPLFIYAILLLDYLILKYFGPFMPLLPKLKASNKNAGTSSLLRMTSRVVRPIFFLAAAIEIIVYWPQDFCQNEVYSNLGGCWTPELLGGSYAWWQVATLVAIPDLLILMDMSLRTSSGYASINAQAETAVPAQSESVNLFSKMHMY
tara:strand:- start:266 stop:823 length:558 start_codon:yes stop_codon:yes gene_type:complete